LLVEHHARARQPRDPPQQLTVGDPRPAPEHDRRADTTRAALPTRLAFLHEVADPVDEALEHVPADERPVALLGTERNLKVELAVERLVMARRRS
jgi:hypothetical protein